MDYKKLLNLSKKFDWEQILTVNDPSNALKMLTDNIKKLINKSTKNLTKHINLQILGLQRD